MTIPAAVAAAIRDAAAGAAPAECCGLLLGTPEAIVRAWPARNVASEPTRRYDVDPADHFAGLREARRLGLAVIGAYHSHPHSAPRPSSTDRAEALPEFIYVIAGREWPALEWTLSAYRLDAGANFVELPLVSVQ